MVLFGQRVFFFFNMILDKLEEFDVIILLEIRDDLVKRVYQVCVVIVLKVLEEVVMVYLEGLFNILCGGNRIGGVIVLSVILRIYKIKDICY